MSRLKIYPGFCLVNFDIRPTLFYINVRHMDAACACGVIYSPTTALREESTMKEHQPVIRLYFAKMKEAFNNLPAEEQMAFMQRDRRNLDQLGMKAITMVNCTASDEDWDYVGVEEWPSMAAIEEREKFENEELEVSRYVISKTIIGTPESFDEYGVE